MGFNSGFKGLKIALRHRTEFMYVFKVSIFSVTVDLNLLVVIAEYFSALPFVTSISQLKFMYVLKVSIFSVTVDLSLLVVIAEYFSALPFVTSISQLKFQ